MKKEEITDKGIEEVAVLRDNLDGFTKEQHDLPFRLRV